MNNISESQTGKLWFPQIKSVSPANKSEPLSKAVRLFFNLSSYLNNETLHWENPLITTGGKLFNMYALWDFFKENKKSILVFGNLSNKQIKNYSYQELGFNLFALPGEIFHYNPLPPSSDSSYFERLLPFTIKEIHGTIFEAACEFLKWSRCQEACRGLQESFGHGKRDFFQYQSCQTVLDKLAILKIKNEEKWKELPCGEECKLLQRIAEILETFNDVKDKYKPCPGLAREIALLDCRKYRLAQSKYFSDLMFSEKEEKKEEEKDKFEKIIILEDNQEFRKQLRSDLRRFVEYEKEDIIEADPGNSWENYCLCRKNGKDILAEIIDDNKIEPGEVLTCFDLELGRENIPKTAMGDFIKNIFGGHWIMYKTGCAHPKIPRLVITGYRSQDLLSHIAGGSAFLMKPYTEESLKKQIENAKASIRSKVVWICPENVRRSYSVLLNGVTFIDYENILREWLDQKQVDLEIVGNEQFTNKVNVDLIILDMFQLKRGLKNNEYLPKPGILKEIISGIQRENPKANIVLVIPFDLEREETVSDYYQQLPLRIYDGTDNVIRKPFWFVADGKTNPEECLGNMILEQLSYKGDFDIKYQVLVPLAPIVGRLSKRIKDILENPEKKTKDELYAPLLPYLINAFGLSGRISDIADLRNNVKTKLTEKINEEKIKDKERWENIDSPNESISKISDGFLDALKSSKINRHITLESWLRHIVDKKPGTIFNNGEDREDVHSLIEPLARVFGGSTRYEFMRGSWYKGDKRIDDILIVVEFCAKSSIIGRKFIRETAVKYLSTVAGEDVVLVQEIPIKGFLWE
jgi:hypothetical protein